MRTIEIARRLAELNQKEDAQKAYLFALHEVEGKNPEEEMEAASYLFFSEGNYRAAFTTFVSLYNRGCFQPEIMDLLTQAFYLPNVEEQIKRYADNGVALKRYPYFYACGNDFPRLEDLPIQFFPFDDDGYIPFYKEENRFGEYVNFNHPVIDRYFFEDLEKPILAADVFSQYQIEYLHDTVRKSEWVGRENHIYLHYTSWFIFCAYLQCLDFKKLLNDEKFVFLVENEISQYPIDFRERFGIDYSKYPVKPVGLREYNRLIWHVQLSSHNGGDFFNEIFYGHPNILSLESVMLDNIVDNIQKIKEALKKGITGSPLMRKLAQLHNPTDKDCFIALMLSNKKIYSKPDPNSRIVPAVFFQPHFSNIYYKAKVVDPNKDWTTLYSKEYEQIRTSPIFQGFKYIKTFTPMRRITTSYAASLRFAVDRKRTEKEEEENKKSVILDPINTRLLNRSYLVDPHDRFYQDSILVRFEDGKLNPKATFTALAKFLDVPYTESMTYCSSFRGVNTLSFEGNARGFELSTVYNTYEQYANDDEREYLEYFMRDAYEAYGYNFQYYKGEPVDEEWIQKKIEKFTCVNSYIRAQWSMVYRENISATPSPEVEERMKDEEIKDLIEQQIEEDKDKIIEKKVDKVVEIMNEQRLEYAKYLLKGLHFISMDGQPLQMMKKLELDPALLEQPLYH